MKKQTLIMVLGTLLAVGIGFVVWFQGTKSVPISPVAELNQPTSTSVEPIITIVTSMPTSTPIVAPQDKKPAPKHRVGETLDQCIQVELDLGQEDANAIFLKCLPSAATPK